MEKENLVYLTQTFIRREEISCGRGRVNFCPEILSLLFSFKDFVEHRTLPVSTLFLTMSINSFFLNYTKMAVYLFYIGPSGLKCKNVEKIMGGESFWSVRFDL